MERYRIRASGPTTPVEPGARLRLPWRVRRLPHYLEWPPARRAYLWKACKKRAYSEYVSWWFPGCLVILASLFVLVLLAVLAECVRHRISPGTFKVLGVAVNWTFLACLYLGSYVFVILRAAYYLEKDPWGLTYRPQVVPAHRWNLFRKRAKRTLPKRASSPPTTPPPPRDDADENANRDKAVFEGWD